MEVENRDILRSFLKASERQDEEGMREYLHPEIRVIEAESLPYGGIHEGPDAFMELIPTVFGTWRDCNVTVNRWVSEGEHVILLGVMTGSGKTTGMPFEVPIAEVWTFREGKIIEVVPYYFDTKMLADVAGGHA